MVDYVDFDPDNITWSDPIKKLHDLENDLNKLQQERFVSLGEVYRRLGYLPFGRHIEEEIYNIGWYKNQFVRRHITIISELHEEFELINHDDEIKF